jgi:hypothetical protein
MNKRVYSLVGGQYVATLYVQTPAGLFTADSNMNGLPGVLDAATAQSLANSGQILIQGATAQTMPAITPNGVAVNQQGALSGYQTQEQQMPVSQSVFRLTCTHKSAGDAEQYVILGDFSGIVAAQVGITSGNEASIGGTWSGNTVNYFNQYVSARALKLDNLQASANSADVFGADFFRMRDPLFNGDGTQRTVDFTQVISQNTFNATLRNIGLPIIFDGVNAAVIKLTAGQTVQLNFRMTAAENVRNISSI